ncbi:MAG: glycosyltransferase family 2 protein [Methanomicrobiales archaeon]|nr:glycosyltransferase family 2 protein [Methanomicrobiales archaeon]
MNNVEVTAILPVYNDRTSLENAIPRSMEALSRITDSFELVVAEDGSTDGSAEYVQEQARRDPRIRLVHSDERQGRGRALTRVMREAEGEILCYYDVDLATDMTHLSELIQSIRDGYDLATGSRLLPESRVMRSGTREIPSRVYNWLVRVVLGSTLHDHQCGFKSFHREKVLSLLGSVRATHWFWDTEILVRAQAQGLRVREFPVHWQEGKGTTVRAKDVFSMGKAIFGLWWQLHVEKN